MSKKPAAALSSNLVAVKGAAMPAPDMPGRASPPSAAVPAEEAKAGAAAEVGQPLNFRVPAQFRREFKVYASQHDLKLNELLRLSFEAYRRQQGD
jgi:hypothetical protein